MSLFSLPLRLIQSFYLIPFSSIKIIWVIKK